MPQQKRQILLEQAFGDPNIPKIYANGFDIALGTGDMVVVLKNCDKPVAVLNLSYTLAKTLSIKTQGLIRHLEKSSGNVIMTTDEITKALSGAHKDETIQ